MIPVTIRARFLPAEKPSPAVSSTYTKMALAASVHGDGHIFCYDPGAEKVPDQEVKKWPRPEKRGE
jgi:hypothetical protein